MTNRIVRLFSDKKGFGPGCLYGAGCGGHNPEHRESRTSVKNVTGL